MNNVQDAVFSVLAPRSTVKMHLKSLHDSSFIDCKRAEILITDDFMQANLIKVNPDGSLEPLMDTFEEMAELG